ncbi:MAG: flagellar brake protein [Myxococcales bacterium]|nr:flagellar brake protein [Myxococcales bacterium]
MAPENNQPEAIIFKKNEVSPNFQVGTPIFFELTQKSRRLRAQATLIGWSRPHILITSLPMESRLLIIPTGTELIVRYLLEGAVYGFITRLIHKQQEPFGMWILEYPEVVEIKNLRRSPRIPLYLKVGTGTGDEWEMLDLSNFGALLVSNDEQFIGDDVELSFTLPDGNQVDNLKTKVVRVNYSKEESLVGVQFDEDDLVNLGKIKKYIESCLRRQVVSQNLK